MANVHDVFKQLEREQQIQTFAEEETKDSNDYCMLESDTTRKILIPEKYSIFGVESDEKSNRIKFKFPQHVNDIDLSELSLRINYRNANGEIDQNLTENKETTDDRFVTFEWVLTRKVTAYMGDVDFIVCAIKTQPDGTLINEWNTTIATVQTLEGLEPEPVTEEETEQARDLLTQLLSVMLSVKTDSVKAVNDTKDNAITEITQTKTQAISDIEAEGQTQISAVDAKGGQVLESIPDDYTTLENRVDELEQNRAYVIVGNGSGEFVTLNDSSELKTRNVKLFGKSVQAETTGVQLFNINKLKELDDGVEIIDYSTGEMEITQQNNAMLPVRLSDICPNMVAGQTYYLTGETTSKNKFLNVGAKQWNFNEALVLEESDLLAQCNFKCTTQAGQSGEIIYYKDTFKHIMIVEGTTEKPYEVYTGGEAATEPTPEFPLPITSAGNYDAEEEKYEVGIGVTGKNLFDASKVPTKTQGGVTVTNNGDGSFTVSGSGNTSDYYVNIYNYTREKTLKMFHAGKISMKAGGITNPYASFQLKINDDTSSDSNIFVVSSKNGGSSGIITQEMLDNPKCFARILFFGTINEEIVPGTVKPMLYQSGDGTWEPFKQQLTTLQLPNPLRGIPVDSGGNYTDETGQQWICDYIDREKGKYVQCVQEIVFDGNENNWVFMNMTGVNQAYMEIDNLKTDTNYKNLLSDKFKPILISDRENNYNTIYTGYLNGKDVLCFNSENIKSLSDWKDWLTTNNVHVFYQLKTPIETDLTPDQISALNLSTYQGITNIGTDTMPQARIDVEYIADTKTYIDNAIAEAIAAIPTE